MSEHPKLVGYARLKEGSIALTLDFEAMKDSMVTLTRDGREFVRLNINAEKLAEVINGDREVTSIVEVI